MKRQMVFLGALAALASASSIAQTSAAAQSLHTRALAATCANCHGTEGKGAEGSAVPMLAGTPKAVTVEKMQAFKQGKRPDATVMHQLAKGYSDAQIEAIAEYFANVKR